MFITKVFTGLTAGEGMEKIINNWLEESKAHPIAVSHQLNQSDLYYSVVLVCEVSGENWLTS